MSASLATGGLPVDPVAALALPAEARVDHRVPKEMLVEHGAPTAADKRRIRQGVQEFRWRAALKPATVGVDAYHDHRRDYREVVVVEATLRAGGTRLVELLHRSIPYPLLLVTWRGGVATISAAHKRGSLAESAKTVLDGDVVAVELQGFEEPVVRAFHEALALDKLPRDSLLALYRGWVHALQAMRIASVTGRFVLPDSTEASAARAAALAEHERLESRIAQLQATARKRKQMVQLVSINLELQRLRQHRDAVLAVLGNRER